jgi:hypothetical protein
MPRISIEYDKTEAAQESSFMNATLQGNAEDTIAFSIAVTAPAFELDDQYQIGFMLDEALRPLTEKGYIVEVQIGPSHSACGECE